MHLSMFARRRHLGGLEHVLAEALEHVRVTADSVQHFEFIGQAVLAPLQVNLDGDDTSIRSLCAKDRGEAARPAELRAESESHFSRRGGGAKYHGVLPQD